MPTVLKRGAPRRRSPVKITRVIKDAKPGSLLAKLRELEAKLADSDTPEVEAAVAAELAAHRSKVEHPMPTAKGRHQPGAKLISVGGRRLPGQTMAQVTSTTPTQAHGLRAALGLRNDPEQDQALAQRMTSQARQRAEAAQQGSPGRSVDVPDQAKPTIVDRPRPQTVEYGPGGERLQTTPAMAQVYVAITQLFVAADRKPITLAASEVAKMTGLTQAEVNAAIAELEKRRLLTRQPGRAFATPLWAVAAL